MSMKIEIKIHDDEYPYSLFFYFDKDKKDFLEAIVKINSKGDGMFVRRSKFFQKLWKMLKEL